MFQDEEKNFIMGELQEDAKIGDTLENLNECIPEGKYQIILNYSPKYKKVLPLILVEGREGIRFHTGNSSKDVSGCILLGECTTKPGWISQSKMYIPRLITMLQKADAGQSYINIIKEI
jgi:hypothetical protein